MRVRVGGGVLLWGGGRHGDDVGGVGSSVCVHLRVWCLIFNLIYYFIILVLVHILS